mmetsp:Transcript_72052/g.165298  ORF Transcript_72052/g.165298 Transcript_72052/m.165298 type:complete len:181 (-) Transcript_72052:532-1074(-)
MQTLREFAGAFLRVGRWGEISQTELKALSANAFFAGFSAMDLLDTLPQVVVGQLQKRNVGTCARMWSSDPRTLAKVVLFLSMVNVVRVHFARLRRDNFNGWLPGLAGLFFLSTLLPLFWGVDKYYTRFDKELELPEKTVSDGRWAKCWRVIRSLCFCLSVVWFVLTVGMLASSVLRGYDG